MKTRTQTHARKQTHMHVRNCICVFACKQTQIHADTSACAYICTRAYVRSIVYTCTQFVQTNGLTTRTHVYIINASNAMPKTYLYTYIRAYARTYTHAVDREQYSQTNANAHTRTQTHRCIRRVEISVCKFLRANTFAFCALDLKLSGYTICTVHVHMYVSWSAQAVTWRTVL